MLWFILLLTFYIFNSLNYINSTKTKQVESKSYSKAAAPGGHTLLYHLFRAWRNQWEPRATWFIGEKQSCMWEHTHLLSPNEALILVLRICSGYTSVAMMEFLVSVPSHYVEWPKERNDMQNINIIYIVSEEIMGNHSSHHGNIDTKL